MQLTETWILATETRSIRRWTWLGPRYIYLVNSPLTGWVSGVLPEKGGPPGMAGNWKHAAMEMDKQIIKVYWYDIDAR